MFGHVRCSADCACPAHEFCVNYRSKLTEFLENTTIADIAAFETRRRWSKVDAANATDGDG